MEKKKLFAIDDTIKNQDWIKTRSFDFYGSRSFIEATFGLSDLKGRERQKRLREISEWPTMRNAPDWLRDEIDEALE